MLTEFKLKDSFFSTLVLKFDNYLIFRYDCDDFTRMFYNEKYGVQFGSVPVELGERKVEVKKEIPPYNGFGSPQDSKQNCLSLIAQPPKKDVMKMLENDLKILRYAVVMDSPHPEDKNRKFIISYSLAKDEMQIYEPHQRYVLFTMNFTVFHEHFRI